ncbi:hypothetical protein LINPERHAP2_LOCUS32857, partial [Linum perenne]
SLDDPTLVEPSTCSSIKGDPTLAGPPSCNHRLTIPSRNTLTASYPNPPTLFTTSNPLIIKVNLSPIHGT